MSADAWTSRGGCRALLAVAAVAATACAPCPEGGCGPRTVVITRIDEHLSERGERQLLDRLERTDFGPRVLVQGADGVREYFGRFEDGGYAVPNVTGPEYVVRVGDEFFVAAEPALELGTRFAWRGTRALATTMDRLTLAMSGWTWASSHRLRVFSPGAGFSGILQGAEPQSTVELRLQALDEPAFKLQPDLGDTLWALAWVPATLGGFPSGCRAVAAAGQVPLDGGTNAAVALDTRTDAGVTLRYDAAAWAGVVTAAGAGVSLRHGLLQVAALPQPAALGATVVDCRFTPGSAPLEGRYAVPSALPAAWTLRVGGGVVYAATAVIDGTDYAALGSAYVFTPSGEVTPRVAPPTSLQLNAQDALTHHTLSAAAPLQVTWSAGAGMAAPTRFTVTLRQFERGAPAQPVAEHVARLAGTSFTFPAGVLRSGRVATVTVRAQETTATATKPLQGTTTSVADAVSMPVLVGD